MLPTAPGTQAAVVGSLGSLIAMVTPKLELSIGAFPPANRALVPTLHREHAHRDVSEGFSPERANSVHAVRAPGALTHLRPWASLLAAWVGPLLAGLRNR